MKSIMEEASSIAKAVEKGWIKAGCPKEFSVKVFENAEKNFIGFTTRQAKIGIFFEEAVSLKSEPYSAGNRKIRPLQSNSRESNREQREPREPRTRRPEPKSESSTTEFKEISVIWADNMIQDVQDWIKESLNLMELSFGDFTTTVQTFYLKIQFPKSFFDDKEREKQLYSSLSMLLLQMLKHKYRRPLKGYKIIFSSDILLSNAKD